MIGTVTGYEIGKNRNGTAEVLLLQVRISEDDDIQTVEYMSAAGDDSVPPTGSRVVILSAGSAWKIAIAAQDEITPESTEGERKIYSSDGGSVQAFIIWRTDGALEINGDADFAVAFNDLKAGFDQLVTDFNAHTHPTAPTGPVSTPTTPSTASVDASKIDSVKVP